MAYNFNGWQNADCAPIDPAYAQLTTPRDLYDALSHLWSADTCAPRMRAAWAPENKTLGQCSITAFLAQDIFGGEVYGIPLGDGNFHCYNVVGPCTFDLTSEQFGEKAHTFVYEDNPRQHRSVHFAKDEKRQRYDFLKAALTRYLAES